MNMNMKKRGISLALSLLLASSTALNTVSCTVVIRDETVTSDETRQEEATSGSIDRETTKEPSVNSESVAESGKEPMTEPETEPEPET